jgi:hypothetical protein
LPIQEKAMNARPETGRTELTAYESEQVQKIAAWKSQPPNPLSELWKRITIPGARAVEKFVPKRVVRGVIEKSYDAAERLAGRDDIRRRAGVADLAELRDKPLEECDRLAYQVGVAAQTLAIAEGAATGAGGVLTTLLDVPLLFTLSLRTIIRIGLCYGYPLEHRKGRHFVLGLLVTAVSHSLETRQRRLLRLRELEDLLIEETEEEILADELLSFLFQLEIFEEVPGVGVISGALFNVAFLRRIDVTARRVFQERWLHDSGKVDVIAPAPAQTRYSARGWTGALGRLAYSGCYGLGFGVALPVYAVATLLRPMDNALTRGVRDGAAAAVDEVERTLDRAQGETNPAVANGETTPALMPA